MLLPGEEGPLRVLDVPKYERGSQRVRLNKDHGVQTPLSKWRKTPPVADRGAYSWKECFNAALWCQIGSAFFRFPIDGSSKWNNCKAFIAASSSKGSVPCVHCAQKLSTQNPRPLEAQKLRPEVPGDLIQRRLLSEKTTLRASSSWASLLIPGIWCSGPLTAPCHLRNCSLGLGLT